MISAEDQIKNDMHQGHIQDSTMPKQTALYQKHLDAGAKMVDFHGWLLPLQYPAGIIAETKQARLTAGMFDLSHMGEIEISGPDASAFLQKVATNDISAIEKGALQYNMACIEDGGIIDDFMVYNKGTAYLCVVNASNIENVYNWSLEQQQGFQVHIEDQSDKISLISIQGPASEQIVTDAGLTDGASLFYMHFIQTELQNIPCIVSRSGYTGEDGFEFYLDNKHAPVLWDIFLQAGEKYDMCLCGLGSRDILRLEMGYPLYGNDTNIQTNPIEASLRWAVKPKAKDFIGKGAIVDALTNGAKSKRAGFVMKEKGFARNGYQIFSEGKEPIGVVTSGAFSPNTGTFIGQCYLKSAYADVHTQIYVKIRDGLHKAEVVRFPFVKSRVKKEA